MKSLLSYLVFMLLGLALLTPSPADAKWWIFGQSNEEVSFSYLNLNRFSYDESGPKTSIPKGSLADGQILINGKVKVGKGNVGGVRISTNNKENWQDAKLADDGTFEFRFTPDLNKVIVLYVEATDTAGKVNDVEKTRKEVTIVDSNLQEVARGVLDALIAAYRAEDPAAFMRLVSEDYAGDAANLDRAIRKDFSAFDNIDLRYTLNNLTYVPGGKIFAAINYNRSVTSSRSGKTFSDNGSTEIVLKPSEKGIAIFSMKNPLIFGLSDAAEVATGSSAVSQPVIVVDARGTVVKVPAVVFNQIVKDETFSVTTNADGTSTVAVSTGSYTVNADGTVKNVTPATIRYSATVESGSVNLVYTGQPPVGFDFARGETTTGTGDFFITGGGPDKAYSWIANGASYQDLGTAVAIATLGSAPTSGYRTTTGMGVYLEAGHTYALKLGSGKYALMEVTSASESFATGMMVITMRMKYKYQASGDAQFLP